MGATVENASAEDTRRIIEGKLRELHMDPAEIHVITQSSADSDGMLFLLNNEGVILTVEVPIVSHVIRDEVEVNTSLCSALRSEQDSGMQPSELEVAMNELQLSLRR